MSTPKKSYRYCFVPLCKNTTKSAPDKIFFCVPNDAKKKKTWFNVARRPDTPSKTNFFCCQDHFDVKDDMENYVRFRLTGARVKLKPDVIPHYFDCQPNRKRVNIVPRPAAKKRRHQAELQEILAEAKENATPNIPETISSTSIRENIVPTIKSFTTNMPEIFCSTSTRENIVPTIKTTVDLDSDCDMSHSNYSKECVEIAREMHCSKGIQTNIKLKYRSKAITCKMSMQNVHSQTEDIEWNQPSTSTTAVMLSPTKSFELLKKTDLSSETSSNPISIATSSFASTSSSNWKLRTSEEEENEASNQRESASKIVMMTNYFISNNCKDYTGIRSDWYWIIDLIHLHTRIPADNIKLTLMKIRLDDTFKRLGVQFGLSAAQAGTIFFKSLRMADILKSLISFPPAKSVKTLLPIPFRANYSEVQAIIDCFEIQIEKPSDPVKQALTWSEYKKCNTLKYLISATPDGTINFISSGYGGRISDSLIVEKSGFINKLPENCSVMADRGFKHIQSLLNSKNCLLVRPPSVAAKVKPTKEEVLETKRIASLPIHIERIIRRIREFRMLTPHSCIHHSLIPHVDSILIIAAALVNLQSPVIKT